VVLLLFLFCIHEVQGATYQNPLVHDKDLPDPGGIYVKGVYYVATTSVGNSKDSKFPIRSSKDLIHWTLEAYVFPPSKTPKWAVEDFWAPEIHFLGTHYVVYFAARDTTGMLCVGAAHSDTVKGPYTDIGHPLIRNSTVGYIDPTYFYLESTKEKYVFWKEDGNGKVPPEKYTPIWGSKLADDGLSLVGDKHFILENDPSSWEGPLIEAPWIINYRNQYYLFYSANGYASSLYALGVAKSNNLLGPYEKDPSNPIVHSNDHWSGPGHCSVLRVGGDNSTGSWFLLYHSWRHGKIGTIRLLLMDSVYWTAEWPYIKTSSPSFKPTPVPH